MAISFRILLSTGKPFSITTRETNTFQYVFDKYIIIKCPSNSVVYSILNQGNKVDMNKTLIENNITQGCTVLVMVKLPSKSENYESQNKKNNFYKNQLNINIDSNNLNKNILKHNISLPTLIPTPFEIMATPPNLIMTPPTPLIFQPLPNIIEPSPNIIQPIPNLTETSPNMISPLQIPRIIPMSGNIQDNITPESKICISFLINLCKVPSELFDMDYLCDDEWAIGRKNGPPGYLKDYFPPHGWIGIRLKVLNLCDNGDNTWLGNYNQIGEWYVAYHPIKTINSISGILYNGFRKGPFQECQNDININPLTKNLSPYCGEGVYFIPDINEAKNYTQLFEYLGRKFRIVFMCRINPLKVRITNIGINNESWIVNGDELNDINGRKRDDEVRPYRILFFFEN